MRWATPEAPEILRATAGRAGPPRIAPIPPDEITGEAREVLSQFPPGAPTSIFRTLAHHPVLLQKWTEFGNYVVGQSTLPARDRELVILRVAWRCRSTYVFSAHVPIARRAGASDAELELIQEADGTTAAARHDALLFRAADEICRESMLSDEVWSQLLECYTIPQMLDLIFTIGQYQLVCSLTNTLRIRPEV